MKKAIYFLFISILIIQSCDKFSKYPGFKKGKNGIYYQLLKFGESKETAQIGDYITIDIQYSTMTDSVFFEGRRKIQITEPDYRGSIDDCFTMLAKDEKATFILLAEDFFSKTLGTTLPGFLHIGDVLKITIDVLEVQTEEQFLNEKEAFLSWIEDFGEYEQVLMKQFLQEEKLNITPTESGLYHIIVREGNGSIVEYGDTVTVHYEGKFLNGKFFDSTKARNQAFEFVYGKKWQVVEGLEEAIGRMKLGEYSLFIIPSQLAFGETGSSTGIVPPYTATIFEVELVNLRKGRKEDLSEMNKYDE